MALTQKGTQRIEIIVRKAGSGGTTGANDKSADNANNDSANKDEQTQGAKNKRRNDVWWRTQLTHGAAVAKQIGTQWFGYYLAGTGYRQGDQALQQQLERQVEYVSDVTNVATSVAMGATYGAAGGVPGAILGALMMGGQTLSSLGVKYSTRQRDYNMKIFKENNAIEYKRARAQINLTTGRLR